MGYAPCAQDLSDHLISVRYASNQSAPRFSPRPTRLRVDFPAWPAPLSADAADGGSPPRPSLRPSTSGYSCSGIAGPPAAFPPTRSEEHTSELQSLTNLV